MNVECFLDTNVLLYAASNAPEDTLKRQIALRLLAKSDFGVSIQLLQEFYHNCRVKARLRIDAARTEAMIAALLRRPCVPTDETLFTEARRGCERWQIQYWDAAMLAAASRLGAKTFYSEDLNHGQSYGGVRVINPFVDPVEAE